MTPIHRLGGRTLITDAQTPAHRHEGLLARLHHHGAVAREASLSQLAEAGSHIIESGLRHLRLIPTSRGGGQ
jgi:hypothetical protein